MKKICAWCRKEIGTVAGEQHRNDDVSHGICAACASNVFSRRGFPLQELIDSIDLPVLVVDGDGIVKIANTTACRILGKDAASMQDRRGGEVFECVNARLPGGCGKTIHCSACVVRRSVTTTHRTSLPQSMVPATLKRSSPAGPVNVALQITTVKVGEMVMLRIDRMG